MIVRQFLWPASCTRWRVVLHVVCVVLVVVLSAVPAFAVPIPEGKPEDGNTVIETFITSALADADKQYIRDWLASDRNLLLRVASGSYAFFTVPAGVTVSVIPRVSGGCDIRFYGSGLTGVVMTGWTESNPEFNGMYQQGYSSGTGPDNCIIVSGSIFDSADITLPIPTGSYIAEFEGNLLLRDDGGLFGSEGEGSWWQGILDWLASFWDAFLAFVKKIFVPDSDFFSKWFEEIKEAFDEKVGGTGSLYEYIKDSVDELKNYGAASSGVVLELPQGFLYDDFKGYKLDLFSFSSPLLGKLRPWLNAVLVVITGLRCYRNLIELVNR